MQADDPDTLVRQTKERMQRAVGAVADNLAKLRTGRANTEMLDHVRVDYYGQSTPLNQLANLTTPDARTIMIQPFDPNSVGEIEKAIMHADLGLTPSTTGDSGQPVVRINIPELSEERRKELARVAGRESEEGRISVRNIRREANDVIKAMEKDGEIGEDEARRYYDEIQELTDSHVDKIDSLLERKEQALMQV